MSSRLSRRAVLRGAGVAIALPWLESLARPVRAALPAYQKRFVAVFLPNGTNDAWQPPASGAGSAWQLSAVLEPLASLKSKVTVVSGLDNNFSFNESGSSSAEPAHGRMAAGWLTCVDAQRVSKRLGRLANGISVDQVMAQHAAFAGQTPLSSLQLGLSTMYSFCDGLDCAYSRSISWKDEITPLYKTVDPGLVFEQLVGVWPGSGVSASPRRDSRKSVLDAVAESANAVRARVSAADKQRVDEFLSSLRSVEQRVTEPVSPGCTATPERPDFPPISNDSHSQNELGYDRRVHFDLMNELLVLALQCDRTRVVSYMLEDERSDFLYDFVPKRTFTPLTSSPAPGTSSTWHGGAQNGSQDDFATVVHWHVGKIAELCRRLDSVVEDNGLTLLDNTVLFMGAAMHGANHQASNLPTLLVGGGGGRVQTDQHLALTKRSLRDFYFTLMNGVFDLGVEHFGVDLGGAPIGMIEELLR